MPTAADPVQPRRRTQAERRTETRTTLLNATIECLVTYGYAHQQRREQPGRGRDVAAGSREIAATPLVNA